MNDGPFSLTKWYFDGVAADGRAFIAYWTSVAWRGIAITWQDLSMFEVDGTTVRRSSLAGGTPPDATATEILWRSTQLETEIRVAPPASGFRERLLSSAQGIVDWQVVAPAGRITGRLPDRTVLDAAGYAEVIRMTIPPWQLPIRELRWGRWMDAELRRSRVWVEWRGDAPGTWMMRDGIRVIGAEVSDERVASAGWALTLDPQRTLHDRKLTEVLDGLPLLKHAVPTSVLGLRQTKWLSRGELREGDARVSGSAIHEVVVFR